MIRAGAATPARWGLPVVWIAATALAAYCPIDWLRYIALIVFLISLPLLAAYRVQQRAFGARAAVDLRVGAAVAIALVVLLAVGAVFLAVQLPLHRAPLVLSSGVVSVVLIIAVRLLPIPEPNPIDTDAQTAAAATPVARHRGPESRAVAVAVGAVALVAAVVLAVVSQVDADDRQQFTALGIRQTSATHTERTYAVTITCAQDSAQDLLLTERVGTQAARTTALHVSARTSIVRRITAPASAAVSVSLATAAQPRTTLRSVHVNP